MQRQHQRPSYIPRKLSNTSQRHQHSQATTGFPVNAQVRWIIAVYTIGPLRQVRRVFIADVYTRARKKRFAGFVGRLRKCGIVFFHRRIDVVVGGDIHVGRKRVRLRELGGSVEILLPMVVGAFMLGMLAGLPDPRCAQCVREQGPLAIVGGQMDDVATTGRGWTKHNRAVLNAIFLGIGSD